MSLFELLGVILAFLHAGLIGISLNVVHGPFALTATPEAMDVWQNMPERVLELLSQVLPLPERTLDAYGDAIVFLLE